MLKCVCWAPLTASSTPIPFNEELHGPAGLMISMAKTQKYTYFGTTNIHIYTYIFAHAISLGCIICLLLSRVGNSIQSVFQSVLLWAVSKTSLIWVLGSWIQPPLETKLLGFGRASPSIWQPIFLGTLMIPGDPPLEPLLALLCKKRWLRKWILF